MKKIKITLWVIVVAFVVLLFFQNKDFFLEKKVIGLNLSYVANAYQSPALPLFVWFLIVLVIGLLVSYIFRLAERFKLKKEIKGLKAKIDARMEMTSQLRSELDSRAAFPDKETAAAPTDATKNPSESHDMKASSTL